MQMQVYYLDCHEAGLCCYLVIHTETLLCSLKPFYFYLWPIYWLSLLHYLQNAGAFVLHHEHSGLHVAISLLPSYVMSIIRGGIRKFQDRDCCNCLGESRWEGRPRSYFQKTMASVCHVIPCCEETLFLHECFLDFVFCFVWDGWQIQVMCLHQVLHEALQIRYQNSWNASWGFWRTFLKPDIGFWMAFMFQGQLCVSWRWHSG
jgi:hypothetical protein